MNDPEEPTPDLADSLYVELRRLAVDQMRREPRGHTLQATALVHEAWLRLGEGEPNERGQFLARAATTMRHVLVDHARRTRSLKRGGDNVRVPLEAVEAIGGDDAPDLLALDDALRDLERLDPRAHRIVELRFFGGFEVATIAELLDVGERTVKREWSTARLWLLDRLQRESTDG